jgi:hypothetical protein
MVWVNYFLTKAAHSGEEENSVVMFSFWSHIEQEANKAAIAARLRV